MIDTSALINDPDILLRLRGCAVIHTVVLEELDTKADRPDTAGKNARTVICGLFAARKSGNLASGAETFRGQTVRIDSRRPAECPPEFGYDPAKHDNIILAVYRELRAETGEKGKCILLTGDRGLAVKAAAGGDTAEFVARPGYRKNRKKKGPDTVKRPVSGGSSAARAGHACGRS